jgi:hypothetical protein
MLAARKRPANAGRSRKSEDDEESDSPEDVAEGVSKKFWRELYDADRAARREDMRQLTAAMQPVLGGVGAELVNIRNSILHLVRAVDDLAKPVSAWVEGQRGQSAQWSPFAADRIPSVAPSEASDQMSVEQGLTGGASGSGGNGGNVDEVVAEETAAVPEVAPSANGDVDETQRE